MATTDYAIAVGITRYPGIEGVALEGPENDAVCFKEWLIRKDGGAVPNDDRHVRLVLSSHYEAHDVRPLVHDIDEHFRDLIKLARTNRGRLGRRFYIFLAGHGFALGAEQNDALLTAEGDYMLHVTQHIPGHLYATAWKNAAYFDEIVLFMDCCRDPCPNVPPHYGFWLPMNEGNAKDVRRFFGIATRWGRKTRETREEGEVEVRGRFSRALMAGLNGEACENGQVTGQSLKKFVKGRFALYRRRLDPETPEVIDDPEFSGDEDLVLCDAICAGQSARGRVRMRFTPPESVDVEVYDATQRVVGRFRGEFPIEIDNLSTGIYKVVVPGTGRLLYFEVVGIDAQIGLSRGLDTVALTPMKD